MNAKLFAVLSVAVVLSTSVCGIYAVDRDEEPDGIFPAAPVIGYSAMQLAASFGIGAAVGGISVGSVEYLYFQSLINSAEHEGQQLCRYTEADSTVTRVADASAFTANTLRNYAQLWSVTQEHWDRQAELASFALWDGTRTFSASDVLNLSNIYSNNAIAVSNSTVQVNTLFEALKDRSSEWKASETYQGKMTQRFVFADGYAVESSADDISARFLVATAGDTGTIYLEPDVLDSEGYIRGESDGFRNVPGKLYVVGSMATLTDSVGRAYYHGHGEWDVSGMEAGIYTLSGSVVAGDCIAEPIGSSGALDIRPCMLIPVGSEYHLAVYKDGSVTVDGHVSSSVGYTVAAQDIGDRINPDPADLTKVLRTMDSFLEGIDAVTADALGSARAVWQIYDTVSEKNAWATTLSAISNYEKTALPASMKAAMTVSAMQQISAYYQNHAGSFEGFKVSVADDSVSNIPLVRGSIYNSRGDALYTDVVFTPFFQTADTVISTESDRVTVDTYATAMVWDAGKDFATWYASGAENGGSLISLEAGDYFTVTELGHLSGDGIHHDDVLSLKVREIDPIAAQEIVNPTPPDPEEHGKGIDWLQVVSILAGVLLAILGLLRRDPLSVVFGIALILFGVLFADRVWNWITGAHHWGWF